MKKILILPLLFIFMLFMVPKAEAKIWTRDLVDKVTLDSGYKFSLCTIDLKYDVNAAKNAGFFTVPEKDFEANPNSYPCNKNSQEDILFANITLHFSQANWGGNTDHEKVIQFQNKLYSVDNYGDIFNPDFADTKKAYADLGGVDWFSDTPGLHGIRGVNLIETDPSAKGAFVPNSTFLVIHNPSTGAFLSALFVFNNVVYKLESITNKVTTETTLVDYSQSGNVTQPVITTRPSNQPSNIPSPTTSVTSYNWISATDTDLTSWNTYYDKTIGFSLRYPASWLQRNGYDKNYDGSSEILLSPDKPCDKCGGRDRGIYIGLIQSNSGTTQNYAAKMGSGMGSIIPNPSFFSNLEATVLNNVPGAGSPGPEAIINAKYGTFIRLFSDTLQNQSDLDPNIISKIYSTFKFSQ